MSRSGLRSAISRSPSSRAPALSKAMENRELWEELINLVEKNDVTFYRVKGHVSLDSPRSDTDRLFAQFREWNGSAFGMVDFQYVTEMNNRADALANKGIDENRQ